MGQAGGSILQLKVVLRGTRPPIWRRVLVPSAVTLDRVHHILQTVMGWTDSHLHEFRAGDARYGTPDRDWNEDDEVMPERRTRLGQLLQRPKDRLIYEYDFGDDWQHDILLEAVHPADKGMKYPYVLTGKRACPPAWAAFPPSTDVQLDAHRSGVHAIKVSNSCGFVDISGNETENVTMPTLHSL